MIFERISEYEKNHDFSVIADIYNKVQDMRKNLEIALEYIKNKLM